jgi:hypothetical protein
MARGEALVLDVLPVLEDAITPELDGHAYERLREMQDRYAEQIVTLRRRAEVRASLADEELVPPGERT